MKENVVMKELKEELSLKFDKKEQLIKVLLEICLQMNYNIEDIKVLINEFYANCY